MHIFKVSNGLFVVQLALEKDELMQALASESSQCSKLKVTSKLKCYMMELAIMCQVVGLVVSILVALT